MKNQTLNLTVGNINQSKGKVVALTQEVFQGLDKSIDHASFDKDGQVFAFKGQPLKNLQSHSWINIRNNMFLKPLGRVLDGSAWQESLIKRV